MTANAAISQVGVVRIIASRTIAAKHGQHGQGVRSGHLAVTIQAAFAFASLPASHTMFAMFAFAVVSTVRAFSRKVIVFAHMPKVR